MLLNVILSREVQWRINQREEDVAQQEELIDQTADVARREQTEEVVAGWELSPKLMRRQTREHGKTGHRLHLELNHSEE
jgi:hypothetical protein